MLKYPPDTDVARRRVLLCVLSALLFALTILTTSSHSRLAGAAPRLAAHASFIAARIVVDYRQPHSELLPARAGKQFFRRIMRPRGVEVLAPSVTPLAADGGAHYVAMLPQPDCPLVADTLPLLN
jgi:hypothetical protein